MMRRGPLAVVALLATLVILLAGAGAWVICTEAGLAWSLARVRSVTGGALVVDGVSGTWVRGVAVARIQYAAPDLSVSAEEVRLVLSPWSMLRLMPRITALDAERLAIRMTAGDGERSGPPNSLALPIDIDVASAHVMLLTIERNGERNELRDVALSYAGGAHRHELRQFRATHAYAALQASGTLSARSPFPLSVTMQAAVRQPVPADVHARLAGSLLEMKVEGTVRHAAAAATIDALVTPFAATPIARAKVAATDVDLQRYDAALPRTRIAAELDLRADDGRWIGPLRATNALPGPWDKQRLPVAVLSAQVGARLDSVELDQLHVELGAAGRLSGSAALQGGHTTLKLAVHKLDLRAVHTQLRATQLQGRIDSSVSGDEQSASAVLTQDDIRLAFDARRRGNEVRVQRFVASSRRSDLRGAAQLSLAGARPYSATATLTGFDPSAWGDFPRGAIDGRFTVAGALDADEIRVRYALDRSRLLGEVLEGSGQFAYARRRISAANLRLALGGNAVSAIGAFGAAGDRLQLRIAAPRLSALDPRVSGAVSGTAQLTGTWQAPQGVADLEARRLAYGDRMEIDTAMLRGTLSSLDQRAFDVTLRARGVTTPALKVERIDIAARGTESAHTLTASARGGDVDLGMEVRGGWRSERGWSGTLARLRNTGSVPFELVSPVGIAIGKDSLHVGAFAARLMDGRLDVAGVRYVNGELNSEGAFSNLPVRPLLALAGVPPEPRDTLRLAGTWSVAHAPGMTVSFTVQRESGDLTLGKERPLALGLETLRVQGKLVDDRLRMAAAVRSALISVNGTGSLGTVTGASGGLQIGARSPLEFSGEIDVARLAALAEMFETTAAHFDGRVHAALTGRGTLGAPVVTGTIAGDGLAIALPPQGVNLAGGTLRARLQDKRIDVQQFSIRGGNGVLTAQGTLALDAGQRASLDWRADRLTLLDRPDRRLIVTGAGNATLEQGKLALTGDLRANEGLFQFGASALPTLGPDVVVLGRPPPPRESTTLSRTSLRLAIDLGNDLHILGRGIDAWPEGRVLLRTDAAGKLLAEGTVNTRRGTYTAFGQRLQIDRGRLIFGGAVENPGLDIVAMRKNQAVEAGVAVTGSVQAPDVRIVSNPPVPEGEALSWLVLGHGPANASRADLAMLPLAAAALFGEGRTSQGSLAQSLGIDSIALRGSGTLANNVVAVGKRFSHDLYVMYEQSLGGVANVLKVELNLTRRFLLRAEAGQTSAAGLFFRYAFD